MELALRPHVMCSRPLAMSAAVARANGLRSTELELGKLVYITWPNRR